MVLGQCPLFLAGIMLLGRLAVDLLLVAGLQLRFVGDPRRFGGETT